MADEVEVEQNTEYRLQSHRNRGLLHNYISFAGLAIAAAGLTSFLLLILVEVSGTGSDNPYTALVTYILVPAILIFGLAIAGLGALIERRRRRKDPELRLSNFPIIDFNDPRRRRLFLVSLMLLFIFMFMTAFGSFRAYEYTESVPFCGQACHSVMKPEFVAYQASPHAQVACVECHVGHGAHGYAQAKLNGMRQLFGVASGHYDRPIKTPVRNIPATAETCQKCHWQEKYHGDELRVFRHYGYDEKNSLNQTRMLIKVGGGDSNAGPVGGIHWHMNVENEITFVSTDERRQEIPWVRMKDAKGDVVEFKSQSASITQQEIERAEKRKMDCIDCHNRPAHRYLSPNQALDQAFDAGRLPIELPFLKAKAAETLSKQYATNDEAVRTISADLDGYYRSTYPELHSTRGEQVGDAIAEIQSIYQTYFFPEMKTDYRAHPDNIGHYTAQGCFRCHDGQHVSNDGRVIRNDCAICHVTLDQTFGGSTITVNGNFRHPVNLGDKNTWQCAACHRSDRPFIHPLNLGDISQFQCAECHKAF